MDTPALSIITVNNATIIIAS